MAVDLSIKTAASQSPRPWFSGKGLWPLARFERGSVNLFYRFVKALLIAVSYIAVSRLTMIYVFENTAISVAWLPTGFALGILILMGLSYWPALGIAIFALNVWARQKPLLALAITTGNTLEAVVGVLLYRSYWGGNDFLRRTRSAFKFLAGAAVGPLISALIGSLACYLAGELPALELAVRIRSWWLENYIGVMAVTPFMLSWQSLFKMRPRGATVIEACLLFLLLSLTIKLVFGGGASQWLSMPSVHYPLEYLSIPFLIWAALRLGAKGTTAAVLLLVALSTSGTHGGFGPFYLNNNYESLTLLQLFIVTNAVLALVLTGVLNERSDAEQRLARSNAELQRFAYLASHDLQEPLRTVNSFCTLIERKYGTLFDEDGRQYLAFVSAAAKRMYALINALLEYSRLGRDIQWERVNTESLLDDVLANLKVAFEESGAELQRGKLPYILGDSRLLTVVFQNLIANALKFRRGNELPRISVDAKSESSRCLFSIRDNGIGIAPEHFGKIFGLFQRILSDEQAYPGVGLGLAVCKKIVEDHGGEIWVESTPGMGSTFYFSLIHKPGAELRGLDSHSRFR